MIAMRHKWNKLDHKKPEILLTEKQIEDLILNWLNMQTGVWARKVHTIGVYDPANKNFRKLSGFAEKGVSDIAIRVFRAGMPWGKVGVIEVKTYKNAIQLIGKYGFPCTPDQASYIEREIRYGGFGGVAWSLEMAMEICKGHL